jgi:hypothetical protein
MGRNVGEQAFASRRDASIGRKQSYIRFASRRDASLRDARQGGSNFYREMQSYGLPKRTYTDIWTVCEEAQ